MIVVDVDLREQLLERGLLDVHLLLHQTHHVHHDGLDMEGGRLAADHVVQRAVDAYEHQFEMIGDGRRGDQVGIQTFEEDLTLVELSEHVGEQVVRMVQVTIDDGIEQDGRCSWRRDRRVGGNGVGGRSIGCRGQRRLAAIVVVLETKDISVDILDVQQ